MVGSGCILPETDGDADGDTDFDADADDLDDGSPDAESEEDGGCGAGRFDPGCLCHYGTDHTMSMCVDDTLIYCGSDDYVVSVECGQYCSDRFEDPSVTGACGYSDEMGANHCLCSFTTCTHEPYCADVLWLVQCNAYYTYDEYVSCNAYCISVGWDSGVCELDRCSCV